MVVCKPWPFFEIDPAVGRRHRLVQRHVQLPQLRDVRGRFLWVVNTDAYVKISTGMSVHFFSRWS